MSSPGQKQPQPAPRRSRKRVWQCVLALLLLGLLASWIVGGALCMPYNRPVAMPADFPVEAVTFPSTSGATIHGWLAQPAGATNRGIILLQHGVRTDRTTMLGRARLLTQAGYTVLLFDFQAHGESLGQVITFGWLESRDSQAAVQYVKTRFPGQPIGVDGVSMGAAAAVLADPALDVQAIVLEMMYPDLVTATKDRIQMRLGSPARLLSPLLTGQVRIRTGCTPDDLRPIDHVGHMTVPKLFLAGTADRETHFDEAQAIFARAAEPKQFAAFTGAGHEDLYKFAPGQYQKLVLDFFNANLKPLKAK